MTNLRISKLRVIDRTDAKGGKRTVVVSRIGCCLIAKCLLIKIENEALASARRTYSDGAAAEQILCCFWCAVSVIGEREKALEKLPQALTYFKVSCLTS